VANRQARRAAGDGGVWQAYRRNRYAILFFSLLLLLIALPAASAFGLPSLINKILIAACLMAAVMPNATKRTRVVLLGGMFLLIALRFAAEPDATPINFGPILTLYGLTGLLAAGVTLRFVVQSPRVDSETLYAALSTYLLAGLFFGVIYSAVEFMAPGSFSGPTPFDQGAAIYYSFVTLATLGYGDFLPRTEFARGIATFEVIGGQLYLAVMVARLIGAFGVSERPS